MAATPAVNEQPKAGRLVRMDEKAGRHTKIPNAIIDDPTLDVYARGVYAAIRRRDWNGDGWVFTWAELQAAVPCSKGTLWARLRLLKARGLVRTEGSPRRPQRYFVLVPPLVGGSRDDTTVVHETDVGGSRDDTTVVHETDVGGSRDERLSLFIDDQRRIKDDSAAAQQRAAPLPDSQESIGAELTGHAVAAAILEAQGRPASPAAVARMAPACTDEVTVPYRGQVTLVQIRACLVAMRRKKFFREKPHALTPRRLGEDLGPWLRCDEMRDGSPPERVLCDCLTREGYLHTTARCGLSGKVSATNYREQGRGWRLHTPAGVVDEREDDHGSSPGG